jgi:hypothetical protein
VDGAKAEILRQLRQVRRRQFPASVRAEAHADEIVRTVETIAEAMIARG